MRLSNAPRSHKKQMMLFRRINALHAKRNSIVNHRATLDQHFLQYFRTGLVGRKSRYELFLFHFEKLKRWEIVNNLMENNLKRVWQIMEEDTSNRGSYTTIV